MVRSDEVVGRPGLPSSLHPAVRNALVAAVGLATAAAVFLGNGRPVVAVLPVLIVAGAYAAWHLPLRSSAAVLVFLSLALDTTADALGAAAAARRSPAEWFSTPFVFVGDLLHDNLDRSLNLAGVRLSGLEAAVLLLFAMATYRRAKGNTVDVRGRVPTARVLRDFVLVYLAAVAYAVANGVAHGGALMIWQIRLLLQIPLLFFFFQAAFRGPGDLVLLGRVVVGAALVKALLSIWIRYTIFRPDGTPVPYTTNHGDSMLYAMAILVLVTHATERTDGRRIRAAALLVPVLLWGMATNGRRIAWIELGMTLLAVHLLSPWRPWKRAITRVVLVATPLVLLYVAVGWNSGSAVFWPVRTLRGLTDGREDASTYWREVENWNIAMTMREHPVAGRGLGREYVEFIPNADISDIYPEWKYWPHNSVLGLLLFTGLVGFTGLWALYAVPIFLAIRSFRRAQRPEDRAGALCAIGAVLCCVVQAYGDIGAPFTQYRVFAALALAITGKLAVSTGAWPTAPRRHVGAGAEPGRAPSRPAG